MPQTCARFSQVHGDYCKGCSRAVEPNKSEESWGTMNKTRARLKTERSYVGEGQTQDQDTGRREGREPNSAQGDQASMRGVLLLGGRGEGDQELRLEAMSSLPVSVWEESGTQGIDSGQPGGLQECPGTRTAVEKKGLNSCRSDYGKVVVATKPETAVNKAKRGRPVIVRQITDGCRKPGCGRITKRMYRGLCWPCYTSWWRASKRGVKFEDWFSQPIKKGRPCEEK